MSQIRSSQVFAAARQAALEGALAQIRSELIPAFNAEAEDIRREHAQIAKSNKALADNKMKARMLALVHGRQQVLAKFEKDFMAEMEMHAGKLDGVKFQCTEVPRGKTKEVTVPKVKFGDGSIAKWPKLFVPFREFERV